MLLNGEASWLDTALASRGSAGWDKGKGGVPAHSMKRIWVAWWNRALHHNWKRLTTFVGSGAGLRYSCWDCILQKFGIWNLVAVLWFRGMDSSSLSSRKIPVLDQNTAPRIPEDRDMMIMRVAHSHNHVMQIQPRAGCTEWIIWSLRKGEWPRNSEWLGSCCSVLFLQKLLHSASQQGGLDLRPQRATAIQRGQGQVRWASVLPH